jgi:hypothetical protein
MTIRRMKKIPSRVQNDWHSAARQSKRDYLRAGWARHVLEEESRFPLTHSAARIRLAQNIVAQLQIGTVEKTG